MHKNRFRRRKKQKYSPKNSLNHYCFIAIGNVNRFPPERVKQMEEWAKEAGESFYEGHFNSTPFFEKRLKEVLTQLKNEGSIAKGYDYTWFRWVIQHNHLIVNSTLKTGSHEKWRRYLTRLGIENVPDRYGLHKYYQYMHGDGENPYKFDDCLNDPDERSRRNTLIARFIEMMNA